MTRDVKLVQRGVNVQANDLAVPPGTPLRARNIDFQRDGVAARRAGFDRFDDGIPWTPLDGLRPMVDGSTDLSSPDWNDVTLGDNPNVRGMYELFARDHAFAIHGGFAFTYDESANEWMSVPVSMSHRMTFFGNYEDNARAAGLGRAVQLCAGTTANYSPLSFQTGLNTLRGCVGNRASEAAIETSTTRQRLGSVADVCSQITGEIAASDSTANVIWDLSDGSILAGSLTASGATNGTGAAATFSGPSWMCANDSASDTFFVADNGNMIRKVTTSGVVTTLAGSITAGDSDGYKIPAAGLWTNVNATLDQLWGSLAYSPTLGTGQGRVCALSISPSENEVMTSDNGGATWTSRALPSSRQWRWVTWAAGLGLFVAVASDGTLAGRCATSPDGITWTSRTMPNGEWASVAWSSTLNRLVAVGLSGGPNYACTSTDGITWTTSGVTQVAGYWVSVIAAGALGFVALGQFDTGNGQVMVASTGLNWSVSGVSVPEANQWKSLAWSGTTLVAVSIDGTNQVMTSTNGTTWTARAEAAANQWYAVTWSDSFDVFIAVSVDGTNRIMYSPDGAAWTSVAAPDAKQWAAIVDCPTANTVVATALADLDSVMYASATSASSTGALFRTISGMAVHIGYLYVTESAGNRVRKVNTTTGEVTLLAGSASAVSGYTDATGSAARFNTPVGCEVVTSGATAYLYVGDTGNWRIRRIDVSTGVVTSYAGTGTALSGGSYANAQDGITGGASPVILRSKIRGKYKPIGSSRWFLVLECDDLPVSTTMMDVALLPVTEDTDEKRVYCIARSPDSYPDGASGPNKLDTFGPNIFGLAEARGVDCGNGAAFTTSERPHAIDAWTRNVADDPMPRLRPLGIHQPSAPVATSAAGTTFAAGTAVAYRVVIGLNLPDGRVAFGPPSERITLIGSVTATWSGSITAYPAPGLPYDGMAFAQVYRTRSVSSLTDPGDQMFLCYEAALTYGSGLTIADQMSDDLLGAELYTNATEDGVTATALPPPTFATEIAAFNNRAVLGNYVRGPVLRIKVLGTSALVAGTSTITISQTPTNVFEPVALGLLFSWQLTIKAISGATNPAANQFQIATGGTAAQNAVQTARNIATVINRSPDAMLFAAQYDESEPGTVIVTSLWPGTSKGDLAVCDTDGDAVISPTTVQSALVFSTNAATAFQAGSQASSTRSQNLIAYSDQGAFDSFPIVNELSAGGGAEGVVRLLPISDTLLIVKDDSVMSTDSSFDTPRMYDPALSCSLPASFARVNNQWIGLFTRGFVALSASQGVALGRPIDRDVSAQYGAPIDGFTADHASAAAIDLSGNYLCSFNNRLYAFNIVAQAWSDWSVDIVAGDVSGGFEPTTVGAYLDSFMLAQNGARSLLRQRRYQRDGGDWCQDFADPTYAFGTGTLAANLQTITIAAYDAEANAGELPPILLNPPAGAVAGSGIEAADYLWAFSITAGATTERAFGVVTPTTPASATSAITIALAQPLSTIAAGSVVVTGYPPIICRVQYAPFASPGSNAGFGDALVTIERSQPGYLVGRFFGRTDYGDATEQAIGWFGDSYGVSRAVLMGSITASDNGVSSLIAYEDVRRIPTPRERAIGQTLGLELIEGTAWQPLAIKAVTLDKGDRENTKVGQ